MFERVACLVPGREDAERARGREALDEVLLEAARHHAERLQKQSGREMMNNGVDTRA